MNQSKRCPVLLEACQGRLHSLSFDAHQADIFSSTSKELVLYFITHQQQLNMDHGPLSSFAAATLHMASLEGWGDNMAVWIKLPSCFGSSKCTKYELIMEAILSRGPLWQNVHYMERKSNGEVIIGQDSQPLCQELEVSLCPRAGGLSTCPLAQGIHPH